MTSTEAAYLRKIALYEAEASNWTKPERWREMARLSAYETRLQMEAWGGCVSSPRPPESHGLVRSHQRDGVDLRIQSVRNLRIPRGNQQATVRSPHPKMVRQRVLPHIIHNQ